MRILIAEDEPMALKHLLQVLSEIHFQYNELSTVRSVREIREYLYNRGQPDLILLDVELQDGRSIDIFDELKITSPVIFISAFDAFVLDSFKAHNLDYLLKPLSREDLEGALNKYQSLVQFYRQQPAPETTRRERLIVRKGQSRMPLLLDDIAFFYSEMKLAFAVDFKGERYFLDYSLNHIEQLAAKRFFFRITRQIIVHIKAVREFRSIEFSKIELTLLPNPWIQSPVIISQFTAPHFKSWIDNL
jgi:two-component system, LytTR family, response regulator LytT